MGKAKSLDNRGTSLIELMVVMAILAVLAGGMVSIMGFLNGKEAKQCAYKMKSALDCARVETMSKSNGEKESVYLTFQNIEGQIYAVQKKKDSEKKELVGKNVTITAQDVKGTEILLENGSSISVYFKRTTGALYDEADNFCKMQVSQGKVTYVVNVDAATGRISYERES